MGKNLNRKECGRGICQRKAGLYSADTHLYKLCDETGINRFCMHVLRHDYATRVIEIPQKLPGRASIKTAMDRYVHEQGCTTV